LGKYDLTASDSALLKTQALSADAEVLSAVRTAQVMTHEFKDIYINVPTSYAKMQQTTGINYYENNNICIDVSGYYNLEKDSFYNYLSPNSIYLISGEAKTNISDSRGNLLFAHFQKIHNLQCDTVNHASVLKPSNSSSTNGHWIIPFPNDTNRYYVFALDFYGVWLSPSHHTKLIYAVFNKTLDVGKGDVENGWSYFSVDPSVDFGEKLLPIKHANGHDWWLLAPQVNSNIINKYLITDSGIAYHSEQAVGDTSYYGGIGEICASWDGARVGLVDIYGLIEAFDFDRCSGNLELKFKHNEYYDLQSETLTFLPFECTWKKSNYGCALSPDGSKLYVSNCDSIMQYNLDDNNPYASKIKVFETPNLPWYKSIFQLELLANGKIVFKLYYNDLDTLMLLNPYIRAIENPNELGAACNVNLYSIRSLASSGYGAFPTQPNYRLGPLAGSGCDTIGTGITNLPATPAAFTVVPNPFQESIMLQSTVFFDGTVRIISLLGQTLLERKVQGSRSISINTSALAEGVYMLTYTTQNGTTTTQKIVKE
jgi:hypothetical protein